MKRIIVIGGLSAGPSAAAKARREDENAEILLFEKGANVSYATCGMPYAFSGVIEDRNNLMVVKPELLQKRFNIDVRLQEEIIRIDTKNKIVYSKFESYNYDKLIFATGAKSIVPPIQNIKLATNWSTCRSMVDFDKITTEGLTEVSKHITIIGAGLIGVEIAENLIKAGKKVTLIEGDSQILNMWQNKFGVFAQKVLEDKGIEVLTSSMVSKFDVEENGRIRSVIIEGKDPIMTDFVILSVGIKPNTELLIQEGAEHVENGALVVNEQLETSIPNVFAAGDNVVLKNLQTSELEYFPLGTHSNKGGRTAGANAVDRELKFKGAYKTAIIKLFDYTMARTGLNPKKLRALNMHYETVLTISGSTPGYYPGQKDLIMELYYNPNTKELLGAELFGEVGVDKRIDVLSTAIYAKLKVTDLPQLDLAYAPPFSPAKDPIVVTGFVAENMMEGKSNQVSVEEVEAYMKVPTNKFTLVDVRTPKEYRRGTISGAMNIPLETVREDVDKFKNLPQPIAIFCQKGLRGYLAELILKANGIRNVVNIAGGYKIWSMYSDDIEIPEKVIS